MGGVIDQPTFEDDVSVLVGSLRSCCDGVVLYRSVDGYGAENFGDASRAAVMDMVADINGALANK